MITKLRMITFKGKFDINEWAAWAENFGIDGRAINFALYYNTELFEPKNNVVLANARNFTTFCRSISNIKDWENTESLDLILQLSSGCFLESNNTLGSLFITFINNKLDKLISPKELLTQEWNTVKDKINNCVYKNNQYQAHIANILGTRLLNYCDKEMTTQQVADIVKDRLLKLIQADPILLNKDILYNIVKVLSRKHSRVTNKWYLIKEFRDFIL